MPRRGGHFKLSSGRFSTIDGCRMLALHASASAAQTCSPAFPTRSGKALLPACRSQVATIAIRKRITGPRASSAGSHGQADTPACVKPTASATRMTRMMLPRSVRQSRDHQCGSCPSRRRKSALMMHRTRQLLVRQRTIWRNALRGHLAKFGIVLAKRRSGTAELLKIIEEGADSRGRPQRAVSLKRLRRCVGLSAPR